MSAELPGDLVLPPWIEEWLGLIVPLAQVLLILFVAWLLRRLFVRLINRLDARYRFPAAMAIGARRILSGIVYALALLLVLERLGVSGAVLWTAFTGFAAVGAVAFFAAWSVLSNIFCTLLILFTRPFRLYDVVELIENGEKPGLKGQVVDINMIFTTLREQREGQPDSALQIPNNLFFQRAVRRLPPTAGDQPLRFRDDPPTTVP